MVYENGKHDCMLLRRVVAWLDDEMKTVGKSGVCSRKGLALV
jgi:hypothetical protein